jgi:hypothetical protein
MEEVITCVCGEQKRWIIYEDRIECKSCGEVFWFDIMKVKKISVHKINEYMSKIKNRKEGINDD